jgi:hypothetical protein
VNAVCSKFRPWVGLALASLFLLLGSGTVQAAPTVTLTTNRGCGGSATFQNGETIRVLYSVSENATVTITLTRPDGFVFRPVFQQFVPAGATREYLATVGGVSGPRQLFLDAFATSGHASVECIYYGVGGPPFPPPPPPPPTQLTASLDTNKGCGPTAVFAKGELSLFRYRVSHNALVTLRLLRPDGSVSTLLLNQPITGGVTRTFQGVIGDPPGERRLILDATAGSQTAHVECTYTGQAGPAPPPPASLALSVDRGCGANYRLGERVTITYRSLSTTSLTLLLRMPDGTTRVIFANRLVAGGATYALIGVIGTPLGERTLTLQASGGAAVTCKFTAIP